MKYSRENVLSTYENMANSLIEDVTKSNIDEELKSTILEFAKLGIMIARTARGEQTTHTFTTKISK